MVVIISCDGYLNGVDRAGHGVQSVRHQTYRHAGIGQRALILLQRQMWTEQAQQQ
ncbi:hypothetical protein NT01EI_1639 [Edwardsiella ictaluri 93-146]|uniref:Uncharacterized protein n=1 Tax=Edwardsiella ictaluri (strain 93-146) TaxID=634503 RepID=C5B9X2_EDWI9|nr:hypothetical protein NT01EI_1639 [Edwardsiella ictaluri 93-146]